MADGDMPRSGVTCAKKLFSSRSIFGAFLAFLGKTKHSDVNVDATLICTLYIQESVARIEPRHLLPLTMLMSDEEMTSTDA
jgi:hypothetical protein